MNIQVPWLQFDPRGVLVLAVLQPSASRNEITGPHGDPPRLRIRIKAPPVDGKANEELIAFLSKKLKIPKSSFEIKRGQTSKRKDIIISGVSMESVAHLLESEHANHA